MTKASVYLNGRFAGFTDDADKLVRELREKRRAGEIDSQLNVANYERTNEVFINTDDGRARRPLIIVKNNKPLYTEKHAEALKKGETTWAQLVKQGVIEYLDAEEEENAFIAFSNDDLAKATDKGQDKFTHVEIDPLSILGYASAQNPFPEYNAAPRVLMAAQHTKQALGLYAANYNFRSETRGHVLFYPQRPLVSTDVYEVLKNYNRPSGQNMVVAVLSYYGFNLNDAIVLNRASVDRAMGRSAFIRTYSDEESRYPGGQRDKYQVPEEFVQGYLGPEAYANLDESGFISPEAEVGPNQVLIGKTAPPRFLKEISALEIESEKRREASVTVRGNEGGTVDAVMISETLSGNRFVKIRVRTLNVPEIGDKFASRFGQKGIVALLVQQEDLPFTRDGIVPDLIINPHAIPGRMTAGHLLEMLGGKAAAVEGNVRDGTAFRGEGQADFEKVLHANGFRCTGTETLYDGITGMPLKAKIYLGVIYYQRLHHLVSLKIHARSRGPVQMLTHQPTEGRAREGGLRLGEMERDCFIGYGAASLLKERMLDSADKTTELVCNNCGSLAVHDKVKNRRYCPICESSSIADVEMSYAFKLLLDEMKSIGIFPKLKLRTQG